MIKKVSCSQDTFYLLSTVRSASDDTHMRYLYS